jgi:tape measure domain-containing protein
MSKVVDSRVVEMRFDNAQFERNVKTTMSTLDKLKEKLKFSGASKGLDDIEKSAKQVDMSGLGRGVDTIKMKFSAMEVIAMTALSNITTTAMQVGKSIADALTIDPIKDGFTEYETQMNAVQTILANTQKEGTTVKDVNKALDELNTYADKTIYNFTEMTRNIGTFTAAGVKLDASVSAIKGIANLAAVSGSTSQQASTAMYQLSQALAAGKVQLMDWNSVVNAGMGGQVFQDALIRTSEHLGTGAKEYIEATGSFRNSLEKGWLTTDVLTQTLDQFATAADTQEEYNAAVKKFVDQGYTQEQAKEMADMAKTAGNAATKVKTFTQLIDTLKEALGSGWTKTWQLIIGDFEDAKEIWTKVSDVLSNLINKSSDARNKLVKKVMNNPYSGLLKSINEVTDKASGLQEIVNNVIRGDYGNGQPRFDKLAEQGYNWARVQNMVNEQLGCSFRYNEELGGSQEDLQKTQAETIAQLVQMSDAQLKEAGFTKGQIKALRGLQEQSEKTGVPIQDLINTMSQMSGRDLLFGSFENIGKSIFNLFSELKRGWNDVFNPPSAYTLYNILYAIYNKTAQLAVFTEDHGEELRRTMAGLAAVLDIIKMTVGGALKFGLKALNAILSAFGMDTLDLTANLGDLLVQFDKWLKVVDPFEAVAEKAGEGIKFLIDKIKELYEYLNKIPQFNKFFNSFKNIDITKFVTDIFNDIENFDFDKAWDDLTKKVNGNKIGKTIIDGLKKGLNEGITAVPDILISIGKAILDSIKEVLDINSPSKETFKIGEWTIEGLLNGLKNKASDVIDYLKGLGGNMLDALSNVDVDWGSVIAVSSIGGLVYGVNKLMDVASKFASPFEAIASVIDGLADIEASVSKNIKANAFKTKMDGIKQFVTSLVIVAGSIYILGKLDTKTLAQGGLATAVIAGVLVGIAVAMSKITAASATIDRHGIKIDGLKAGITSIGTAILLIGTTVKILGSMNLKDMEHGFAGLAGIVASLAVIIATFGIFVKDESAKNIDKLGKMMKNMATAMLLMAGVVKIIGTLSAEEILRGVAFATGFSTFVLIMGLIGAKCGEGVANLGDGLKSLVIAMGMLVGVTKLIGYLSIGEIAKGAVFAGSFLAFIEILKLIRKSDDGQVMKGLTRLLLSVSISMALMAGVVKLVSYLSVGEMVKGGVFVAAFTAFVYALVKVTTIASNQQTAKIAASILSISVAVGILAGVSVLLGMISIKNLAKGETAIALLCGMMGMFAVVEKASSVATTSIKTIVVMTAVVAALGGLLVLMSKYDFNVSASNATALSAMMLGLAAATAVLGKIESVDKSALIAVGIMTGVLAGVAVILGIMDKLDISASVPNVIALSIMLNAICAAALIASKIPPIPPSASLYIAAFVGIITALGAVIVAVAGVIDLIPGVEEFLDGGIKILVKIGTGIGEFVGSLVGGVMDGIAVGATKDLPEVGKNIAEFLKAFSGMDNSVKTGIEVFADAAGAILSLSKSNILDGIANKLGFNTGLDNFGEQAKSFGKAMHALSDSLTGENVIDTEAVKGVAKVGQLLAALANDIPPQPGDILKKFVFSQNLGEFGKQVETFGKAMSAMSKAVSGENAIDTDAVKGVTKAGKMLSALADDIPPHPGDILEKFVFSKDLGEFGKQAEAFGKALSAMSKAITGENAIDVNATRNAVNAGNLLSALKDNLPKDPGAILSLFTENKNLGKFGEQAQKFGEAISAMSKAITGENAIDTEAVSNAKNIGTMMTELQKALPKDEWFDGVMQLDDFGSDISAFGQGLLVYNANVADIDFTKVSASVSQAKRMVSLANSIYGNSSNIESGIKTFKDFEDIGETIKDYSDDVSNTNMDSISNSISIGFRLKTFISSLKDINTTGITSFKDAVSKLGKVELGSIKNTLNESAKTFSTNGLSIVEALSSGMTMRRSKAISAMSNIVNDVQKTITNRNENFKKTGVALISMLAVGMAAQKEHVKNIASQVAIASANGALNPAYSYMNNNGRNLGLGLVYGVLSMQQSAYNAGFALGQAAVRGERAGQQSRSPSKATYQSGIWLGEGMINGCRDIATKVFSTGKKLGTGIVDSVSEAMQSAEDIFDSTVDVAPVITPVVDLTDIQTGAARITSMFNNPSVTPMTNIRAISGMMDNRQNGNNEDVVNAINGLKKSIGNAGNTYNNISGITYDNGSAVSEAIETLVRAAKIERRR